ncbi:electron transfer flavoprotein subunit alpha/FixB family protein [candidate division KSB1 bacterium]|nr:electron transfer flavoprotein subunit alpha/FixB family protein [candidate division KSB1 bacterium]
MAVLVFAERRNGDFRGVAYEALGAGKGLADSLGVPLAAAVVGSGVEAYAGSLGDYGADEVLVAESDELGAYSTEGYTQALARIIEEKAPEVVLLAATAMGRDLAARVAARVGASVVQDCIGIGTENGKVVIKRPVYAGKVTATIQLNSKIKIITLRPKMFPPPDKMDGKAVPINKVAVDLQGVVRARVVEMKAKAGAKVDLTEADIIVSGGRGLKGPENFGILEELADALGGVVGASRAAVDADWRTHDDQVGQTGKVVVPNLYIACGISGAIQHLAGMKSSKVIVAINKDQDAPIFKVADYGIVGDLFQVVPELTKALKDVQQ